MALAINFFRVKARRTYRQIRVRIARINAYLGEAISGMAVIQLFAREQKSYREFEALNADHRDAYHLSNLYEAGLYSMHLVPDIVKVFHRLSDTCFWSKPYAHFNYIPIGA